MVLVGPRLLERPGRLDAPTQVPAGTIAPTDLDLFHLTDDPADAIAIIRAFGDGSTDPEPAEEVEIR